MSARPYRGVFPVAPTVFDDRGNLDLDGQRRCIDFMIDAGSHGVCILANFSEQFGLTDDERESVMRAVLEHVAGRVARDRQQDEQRGEPGVDKCRWPRRGARHAR